MKIIRVEPVEKFISLTWMIGSRCNYDCMYCPEDLHDNTSAHPDLDQLKQIWISFYEKTKDQNLPYRINMTGGEVTANRSFLPLVEFIKNNFDGIEIFVLTNGSASENYYKKLASLANCISFSVHSEFFNEQEFFHKVKTINDIMIRPTKSVHVNIMDEFWNQDRISLYKKYLDQLNISYSVNKLFYARQIREYPLKQGVHNLDV